MDGNPVFLQCEKELVIFRIVQEAFLRLLALLSSQIMLPEILGQGVRINRRAHGKLAMRVAKLVDNEVRVIDALTLAEWIGELVEGKPPKDQPVAEDVQEDADDGPRIALDRDDPGSSTVEL